MSQESPKKSLPSLNNKNEDKTSNSGTNAPDKSSSSKHALPKLGTKSSSDASPKVSSAQQDVKTEMNNPVIEQNALDAVPSKNSDSKLPKLGLKSAPKTPAVREEATAVTPPPANPNAPRKSVPPTPQSSHHAPSVPPPALKASPQKPLAGVKAPESQDANAEDNNYYLKNSPADEESFLLPPPPPELDLDDDIANAPTLINDTVDDSDSISIGHSSAPNIHKSEPYTEPDYYANAASGRTDSYRVPGAHLETDVDALIKDNADAQSGDALDPTIDRHSKTMSFHPQGKAQSNDGSAHYTVDVQKYANYDDSESGYSPEVEKNIHYAARSPISRFITDLITVLTRPGTFWRGQFEHPATIAQVHWPHLAVLIILRSVCLFVGAVIQSAISLSQALILAISQMILIFALVWGMSILLCGLMAITKNDSSFDRMVRFVSYSITPLLIVGILSIIPVPWVTTVLDVIAMPWAFLIMGAGVYHYLHEKSENTAMMTSLLCGILLILWTVLPMLVPNLLSGIYHVANSAASLLH